MSRSMIITPFQKELRKEQHYYQW